MFVVAVCLKLWAALGSSDPYYELNIYSVFGLDICRPFCGSAGTVISGRRPTRNLLKQV